MIISIAWKNIWRNKLRSTVVIIAIAFGLFSGIFSVAVMNGALIDRIDSVINNEISSLQIHHARYMENNEMKYLMNDVDTKLDYINSLERVRASSKRYKMEVMLSVAGSASGAVMHGIIPEDEKRISNIYNHLIDSNSQYFKGVSRNPILIGQELADKLKVDVRSKIIISSQSINGNIVNQSFRVCGIYNTGNTMFDGMNVFALYDDVAKTFSLGENKAHEIAIVTKDILKTDSVKQKLSDKYTKYAINENTLMRAKNDSLSDDIMLELKSLKSEMTYDVSEFDSKMKSALGEETFSEYEKTLHRICKTNISVSSWGDLSPELKLMTSYMDYLLVVYVGIILFALGFGIVNTMLMVVLERVKELGMLMAIGMNRIKVFLMIMVETVLLSLTGGFIGIVITLLALWPLQETGIDLSAFKEGFEAMGFSSVIYPSISYSDFVQVVIMVVVVGILASIYPAIKAIRLKPAEAIRSEM